MGSCQGHIPHRPADDHQQRQSAPGIHRVVSEAQNQRRRLWCRSRGRRVDADVRNLRQPRHDRYGRSFVRRAGGHSSRGHAGTARVIAFTRRQRRIAAAPIKDRSGHRPRGARGGVPTGRTPADLSASPEQAKAYHIPQPPIPDFGNASAPVTQRLVLSPYCQRGPRRPGLTARNQACAVLLGPAQFGRR